MFDSKARGDAGHRMVERCDPRGEGYGRALYASRAVIKICFFRFSICFLNVGPILVFG